MRRSLAGVLLGLMAACLSGAAPAGAHTWCGAQIHRARWIQQPQGMRLIVTPTSCGRRTAASSSAPAFAEAIRRGGRGAPHYRSLYFQFICHANFAADKPTWDLEAWRPDVGLAATILARCNPD
jgi:hypothetical protein